MPKKKWERPQLIILVKGNRQESVLEGCKNSTTRMGPVFGVGDCVVQTCEGCDAVAVS